MPLFKAIHPSSTTDCANRFVLQCMHDHDCKTIIVAVMLTDIAIDWEACIKLSSPGLDQFACSMGNICIYLATYTFINSFVYANIMVLSTCIVLYIVT